MIEAMDASISGVRAFQRKLDVTANNIANVNTDEFKKDRALLIEGDNGGVKVEIERVNDPGYPKETVANGEVVETESSNVDLAEELTEMIPTQAGYDANLKAIQTEDKMLGALLDIVG
jgi:flagellar basal-body rod protein FlgC